LCGIRLSSFLRLALSDTRATRTGRVGVWGRESPLVSDTMRNTTEVLVVESALHLYNDDLMNWEVKKETVW
jgi:hypothetical protein